MQKVILITGVSKGLGKALAQIFMKNNFLVVGFSRSQPDFEITHSILGDITLPDDRQRVIQETLSRFGRIDALINSAGIGIYETWEDIQEEDLRKIFELNFFSVIALTQKAIPYLKQSQGQIINLCSVAGRLYMPYMGGYCASKFAIDAFSKSLSLELKPYKINVLNLIVGRVGTGFGKNALGTKKHPNSPSSTPQLFARKVFKAFLKRKEEIFFPKWYRFVLTLSRFLPGLFGRITLKKWQDCNPKNNT